jgi:hypothetical protein
MNSYTEENSNKINYFKKINNKKAKKVNLCQKYFYKLNASPKRCNILKLMEDGLANEDELEQVNNVCSRAINRKNELEKKQKECIKSMILHNKQIPEKWIIQNNYKNMLNKVMEDPIIPSYAKMSKDIFKQRSTSVSIDIAEYEKIKKNDTSSPKFISYINPYSKNYSDSIEKHRVMRDYCYNIKNKKNRVRVNKIIKPLNNNTINDIDKKYYMNTVIPKDNILPYIFPGLKDIKRINDRSKKKDDKDENVMMTSLHYDEKNINKDKDIKIKKDKKMNNDNNINEKNDKNKGKSIELPKIE